MYLDYSESIIYSFFSVGIYKINISSVRRKTKNKQTNKQIHVLFNHWIKLLKGLKILSRWSVHIRFDFLSGNDTLPFHIM